MATIATTGASGFIGRHLLRALVRAGYNVRALARGAAPDDAPEGVTWIRGDLADPAALASLLEGATAVVHGAGAIKALSRQGFAAVNVDGTRLLAELAASLPNPPRFVHLSSLAAREPHLSGYAASKAGGERAVLRLADRMPTIVLRPPAVYGPGDKETLRIFQMAARGLLVAPKVPEARLSLAHVDDVTGAILAALALSDLPAQPVEFDDGHPGGHSWAEIAVAAGEAVGRKVRVLAMPPAALYMAGAGATLAAHVTGRPSVLSWDKVAEALHPDWVAKPYPLAGYRPAWILAPGFRNAAEWAASRGMLKLLR